MKPVIPYIKVHKAIEAIAFYVDVFDAQIIGDILYLKDVEGFEQYDNKIGHAELSIHQSSFFINDVLDEDLVSGNQIHFVIECRSVDELEKRFKKLTMNGTVLQNLKKLFWCELCGFVEDQYGVRWDLYYGMK